MGIRTWDHSLKLGYKVPFHERKLTKSPLLPTTTWVSRKVRCRHSFEARMLAKKDFCLSDQCSNVTFLPHYLTPIPLASLWSTVPGMYLDLDKDLALAWSLPGLGGSNWKPPRGKEERIEGVKKLINNWQNFLLKISLKI